MKRGTQTRSIGYRTKGPDGEVKTCALGFSAPLLALLGSKALAVTVFEPEDNKWLMRISASPTGYLLDMKRGSQKGEINVAWAKLQALPANASGKGRLPCTIEGAGPNKAASLLVDISSWARAEKKQDVLFESWGRELRP